MNKNGMAVSPLKVCNFSFEISAFCYVLCLLCCQIMEPKNIFFFSSLMVDLNAKCPYFQ